MLAKRWWPIGANRLIDCVASFDDGERPVSLFPFFDSQGDVKCLLAIDENAGEVRVVPEDVLIKIPLMNTVRLQAGWLELAPLEDVNLIHETWHFDPMWKLDQPTLRYHPLRDALKETNCINDFPWPVDNVFFERSMQRVNWLHKHNKSENSLTKFKPNHLPAAPSLIDGALTRGVVDGGKPARQCWVLNPIWIN